MITNPQDVEAAVKQFQQDFQHSRLIKAALRVGKGINRAVLALWWFVGRFSAYALISSFLILMGFIQALLTSSDAPPSAFDIITSHAGMQYLLAAIYAFIGWYIAYARSKTLLTVGSIMIVMYGIVVGYGIVTNTFSMRGLTSVLLNVYFGILAIRASWSEHQRKKYEKALAIATAANDVSDVVEIGADGSIF